MATPLTFTFLDPNAPQALEQLLRAILVEKLLAEHPNRADTSLPGCLPHTGRET